MGSLPRLNTDPLDIGSSFARGAQLRQMERQNRLADLAMQRREAEYQREEQARQYLPGALQGDQSKLEQLMQTSPEMGMQVSQYRDAQQQKKIQLSQQQTERAAQAIWYIRQAPDDKKQRLWEDFRDNALPSMAPEAYRLLQGQPWDDDTALAWMAANVPHEMLKQLVEREKFGEAKSYNDASGNPVVGQIGDQGTFRKVDGVSPYSDKPKEEWTAPGDYLDLATGKMVVTQVDKATGKRRDIEGLGPKPPDDSKAQNNTFEQEKKLRDEFDKSSKSFVTIRDAYSKMMANKDNPSAYGGMALIYGLMKLYDPESVVRESEYATAQNAAGVPDRIRNMWNKALSGDPVNESQRGEILKTAESMYTAQQQNYSRSRDQFNRLAAGYKLNPENVTGIGGDYISIPGTGQPQSKNPSQMSDDELLQELQKLGVQSIGKGQIRKPMPQGGAY